MVHYENLVTARIAGSGIVALVEIRQSPSESIVALPRYSTVISLSSIDTEYSPRFLFPSIKYTIPAFGARQ
jgi:hypothetical protein